MKFRIEENYSNCERARVCHKWHSKRNKRSQCSWLTSLLFWMAPNRKSKSKVSLVEKTPTKKAT